MGSEPLPPREPRRLEYMRLADVQVALVNPKGHDDQLIDASLDRFGYVEPVVLDERTGRLVAGHGRKNRLEAAHAAGAAPPDGVQVADDGAWLVPVMRGWASTNDAEAHAVGVALNQSTIAGGWQETDLAALLTELAAGPGLIGTGYTDASLSVLLASLGDEDVPDFEPTDPGGQPRLDQRSPVTCPECGTEFHL